MVIGVLKNKKLNRWLTAFLVLAVFSTFLVNIVFAQSNMQELNSSDNSLDSSDNSLDSSYGSPDSSDTSLDSSYDSPDSSDNSIDSPDDALRMRVGDTLDLDDNFGSWDGYILIIKQIDPDNNEVLMELQLNGNVIDEKRITENEKYEFSKRKDEATFTIDATVLDVSQDAGGEYTDISIEYSAVAGVSAHSSIIIYSIPEGANIYIDGEYVGKTSKTGKDIPAIDLKTHSVHLEMEGYDSWDGEYKFDTFDKKEMRAVLNKTKSSNFTKIETDGISTPTETTPDNTETAASPTETIPAKTETAATPTETSPTKIEVKSSPQLEAHNYLTIYSIPEGAAIYIDGEYLGKTSKTGTDIPVIDLSTHSVLLKKQGYNSWKGKYKFPSLDSPLEMRVVLKKTENSKFTPIEKADKSAPTETVPTKTETSPTKTKTVLTKIRNSQIETEATPTANPNKHTPGFSGITALIILLIGICLRKK